MESQDKHLVKIEEYLEQILLRLDIIINLTLDSLDDKRFQEPRILVRKIERLDATGILLKPVEVGRILGRASRDISSRRIEIASRKTKGRRRNPDGDRERTPN